MKIPASNQSLINLRFFYRILSLLIFIIPFKIIGQGKINDKGNVTDGGSDASMSTGIVSPVINITSISSKEISFPISLVYTGGQGIKVNEVAENVGAGWSLKSTGHIRRTIRGNRDEPLDQGGPATYQAWTDDNWWEPAPYTMYLGELVNYYKNQTIQPECSNDPFCWRGGQQFYYENTLPNTLLYYTFDTEPDLFEFSVGGYSGTFVLDPAGGDPIISPKQDLKIKISGAFVFNNRIPDSWMITTPDGTEYYFDDSDDYTETTIKTSITSQGWVDQEFISAWYLSEIRSVNNPPMVFSYTNGNKLTTWNHLYLKVYNQCPDPPGQTTTYSCDCGAPGTYPYAEPAEDISDRTVIDHVKLISTIQTPLEKIEFNYSNEERTDLLHTNPADFQYPLESVKKYKKSLQTGNDELVENVEFETGYFNGTGRLKLNNLKRKSGANTGQEQSYFFEYNEDENLPEYSNDAQDLYGFYNNNVTDAMIPMEGPCALQPAANRAPDENKAKANVLTKMHYPGGGTKEFEYELNDYFDGTTNQNTAGLRIKKITLFDGINHDKDIITDYKYVLENNPAHSSGKIKPIRKMEDVSYHGGNKKTVILSTPKRSDFLSDHIRYSRVETVQGGNGKTAYEFTSHSDHGDEAPERVKFHRDVNPSPNISAIYDDYTDDLDNDPGAPFSNRSFDRGLVKNIKYYDESDNLLKEIENDYEFVSGDFVRGLRVSGCNDMMEIHFVYVPGDPQDIYTEYYTIFSDWNYLSRTTNTVYDIDANTSLSTVQEYNYESPSRLAWTKTYGSDGREFKTSYKYPQDYTPPAFSNSPEAEAIELMVEKNISTPIEVVNSYSDDDGSTYYVTNANLTSYHVHTAGFVKPYAIYTLDLEASVANFIPSEITNNTSSTSFDFNNDYRLQITYDQYDNYGYLCQSTVANGITTTFLYGDNNQLPISKFVNAKLTLNDCSTCIGNEAAYTGFEENSNGNWLFNSTAIDNTQGHSGNSCAKASPNAISQIYKKFRPDNISRKYRLSAWVKTNASFGNQNGELGIFAVYQPDDLYSNSVVPHSWAQTQFNNTNGEWKYVQTICDLPQAIYEITNNAQPGYDALKVFIINNDPTHDLLIDDVRFEPIDGMVESYIYDPIWHTISTTLDQNNELTGFNIYDDFGRVKKQLDKDRNVLTSYEYHSYDARLTDDHNYTQVISMRTKHSEDDFDANFNSFNPDEYIVSKSYSDGLGRTIQSIGVGQSPNENKDLVTFADFDELGRQRKQYLAYVDETDDGSFKGEDVIEKQSAFYDDPPDAVAENTYAFSETLYESSPLNRITEKGAPGDEWQPGGHAIQIERHFNDDDEIIQWVQDGVDAASFLSFYPENELFKTEETDEHGHKTYTFKDKLGRLICSQADVMSEDIEDNIATCDFTDGGPSISHTTYQALYSTYYVYNDLGQLIYIIPPKAFQIISAQTPYYFTETDDVFKDFIIATKYDERGRIYTSKKPGADWDYFVYDQLDRPVLTQTANQHINHEWNFIKRDALGRTIMTGIYNSDTDEWDDLQNDVDIWSTVNWEKRSEESGNIMGYTNTSFPELTLNPDEVHTVNYYDDYDFTQDHDYIVSGINTKSEQVHGLQTGSLVRILDGNSNYLLSINYYDDKYRPVQIHKQSFINGSTDNWDIYNSKYSFDSRLLLLSRQHFLDNAPTPLIVNTRFTYDHANRPIDIYEGIGQGTSTFPRLICHYEYNELGQVIRKDLDKDNLNTYLQQIDYRYNIRGWLTSINNATLVSDEINSDDNDVFGEELSYTNTSDISIDNNEFYTQEQFNGNISAIRWKTRQPLIAATARPERLYAYRYDDLNRMTAAYYADDDAQGISFGNNFHIFDETAAYDASGNILKLYRESQLGTMDDLTYDYDGNQLQNVTDDIISAIGNGFNEGNTGFNDDYGYDYNGNMILDRSKEIEILYNHLNLPKEITKNSVSIEYTYDGTGKKLSKTFDGEIHDYADGIEYKNGVLQFISTPEGRARPTGAMDACSGNFAYDYFIKDHLGNVRAVITRPENVNADHYFATMEIWDAGRQVNEEETFYNISDTRDNAPTALVDSTEDQAARLNESIGPAKSLHVQEGDMLSIDVKYYYEQFSGTNNSNSASAILSQLANIFFNMGGSPTLIEQQWAASTFTNNTGVSNFINAALTADTTSASPVLAFLTYLTFDAQFNFLPDVSGVFPVTDDSTAAHLTIQDIVMPSTGYTYVYVSNQSPTDVYFDNLHIIHTSTNVTELNDYYPYGLLNGGLSQESMSMDPLNAYKYQNQELETSLGLNMEEFDLRHYDPAIARWNVQDPMMQFANPYFAMGGNPVSGIDPSGGRTNYTHEAQYWNWITDPPTYQARFEDFDMASNGWIDWNRDGVSSMVGLRGFTDASGQLFSYEDLFTIIDLNKLYNSLATSYSDQGWSFNFNAMSFAYGLLSGNVEFSFSGYQNPVNNPSPNYVNPPDNYSSSILGGSLPQDGEPEGGNKPEGQSGNVNSQQVTCCGDKFEIAGTRKDVANGGLDYENYKSSFFKYADVGIAFGASLFGGTIINSNNWLRIGNGWKPSGKYGFRIAWGAEDGYLKKMAPGRLKDFNLWLRKKGGGHFDFWH